MQATKALWSLLMALAASQRFLQQADAGDKKGISLTFVIDATRSMQPEINQVKAAVDEIFDHMRTTRGKEIENYVLVQFRDPDAQLLTVTTDAKKYKGLVAGITLIGNRDCPEMSLKGLRIGLENSLPYSYIFVFTDASAKDYKMKQEIENIIQRTKSKIVFVLTGQCRMGERDPGYQAYKSIAKVSNGHVFNLMKNEVNKVLDYVKLNTGKKPVLDSGSIPSGKPVSIITPVDESVKEFTVTVTGKKPTIDLEDPSGKKTDGKTILNLESVVSKQVEDPKPGNWSVVVGSSSPGDFVLTADSNFTFTAGFSVKPTVNMAETSTGPLIGTANELLIQINNNTNPVQLLEVNVKDTGHKVLKTIKLLPVSGKNGTYKAADKFLPSKSVFLLEIVGKDSKNNSIKRLSDSGITPQHPAPPFITLEKELKASLKNPFTLICQIESLVPFSGSWILNGKAIVPEKEFTQSSKIQYHIENTTMATGGLYTCKARNVAGISTKEVKLNVQVPPPVVKTPISIKLNDNTLGNIPCLVDSEADYKVKWEKRTNTGQYEPLKSSKFSIKGEELVISSVEKTDEGNYKCSATSKYGTGESEVILVVMQPPQVTISEDQKFKSKDVVHLFCNASGSLPIKLLWKKNGNIIEESDKRLNTVKENTLTLKIENSKETDKGIYECQATNSVNSVSKMTKLQYIEKPQVKIIKPTSLALVGSKYSLQCLVTGIPKPVVSWNKNGNKIGTGEFEVSDHGKLSFLKLLSNHTGVYQCVAENEAGKSVAKVNINVVSPPQIENENENNEELGVIGQKKELTCKVTHGEPSPVIRWFKDGEILSAEDLKILEGTIHKNGSLILSFIKTDNEGTYECEATNLAGKSQKVQNLKVHVPPEFSDDQQAVVKVRPGIAVSLPCAANGIPKPTTSWMKDKQHLVLSPNMALSSKDGSLLIMPSTIENNGTYECIAMNSAGRNTRIIHLFVQSAPKIIPKSNNREPQNGTEVILQCEVSSFPIADIKWYKNGIPFNPDSIRYSENNSSIRMIADLSTSGEYECVASNEAGQDRFSINVTVTVPPSFVNEEENIQVSKGETVTLSCHTDAIPPAEYYWAKLPDDDTFQADSVLTFENVDDDFGGYYRCDVINSAGYAQKVISVTVYTVPRINADLPESYVLRIGNNFSIPCFAEGDPRPSVKWLKNGKPIVPLSKDEGLLSIINVSKDDEGIYTCVAENYEGTDQKNMEILIEAPPKMYEVNVPVVEGNESNTVIISCPAMSGIPIPATHWMKDGKIIQRSRRFSLKDKNRSLVIKQAKLSDNGTYSCVATNSAGTSQAYIPLEVYTVPVFNTKGSTREINQLQGSTLHLDCTNSGNPIPKVTWFRNNHPFIHTLNPRAKMISEGQAIKVFNTTKADRGIYQCIVKNKAGHKERLFRVKLYVRPEDKGSIAVGELAEWGPWSSWSECSSPCGDSEQVKIRVCNSEITPCAGKSEEWRTCSVGGCKINGGWSQWGNFSQCSQSCGLGIRFRERYCNNPIPQNGGNICKGKNIQEEACNLTPCPVDGSWSAWSKWHECTGSCINSTMKRMRKCTNPSPAFGGKQCIGPKKEYKQCNLQYCPVNGGWSEWSAWSPCAASCGHSVSFRERSCSNPKPKFNGAFCQGENKETRKCNIPLCDDIPLQVLLKVEGTLNGHKIPEVEYVVNITDLEFTRLVEVESRNLFKFNASHEWYPHLPHTIAPVTWLIAYQRDRAINGYTLTKGVFKIQTAVKFKSGERISIKHIGYGLRSDGILKLHADIQGKTPLFQKSSPVQMEPYEENYVQTGPGELYVSSQGAVEGEGVSIPYTWTKIISYDVKLGKLPFLVEKLTVQSIKMQGTLYQEQGTISSVHGLRCPTAFKYSDKGHCEDVNECSERKLNNCHSTQTCVNHKGSYTCSCPLGLKASTRGEECKDIDECAAKPSICSHKCENSEGSFRCLCPPGLALLDSQTYCTSILPKEGTANGRIFDQRKLCVPLQREVNGVCKDDEPCKYNDHLCKDGEMCINTRGLFECVPFPCPDMFSRMKNSLQCIKYCNVSSCGIEAINYEIITPVIMQLKEPIVPYKNITFSTLQTEKLMQHHKKTFHIVENETGRPFRVKVLDGAGIIYSTKFLPADRQYKIAILATVYANENSKILHTNKFLITILPLDQRTPIQG